MKTLAMFISLTLCACAPQVEGAYTDQHGASAFRLAHGKYFRTNPDGSDFKTARQGRQPLPQPHSYKRDGKMLVVEQVANRAEFEILPDGRLKLSEGGQALIFVRK